MQNESIGSYLKENLIRCSVAEELKLLCLIHCWSCWWVWARLKYMAVKSYWFFTVWNVYMASLCLTQRSTMWMLKPRSGSGEIIAFILTWNNYLNFYSEINICIRPCKSSKCEEKGLRGMSLYFAERNSSAERVSPRWDQHRT